MRSKGRTGLAILVSIAFVLIGLAPCAAAQSVWRMAGTFNSWNAADPTWELDPVQGHTGRFALERVVPPGDYEFKFVRNGDWGQGHFGGGPDGNLIEPGSNLTLGAPALAKFRIELDTNDRTWSLELAEIDQPIVVMRRLGTPMVDEPFVIDLSETLANRPVGALGVNVTTLPPAKTVWNRNEGTITITPRREGELVVAVEVRDGDTLVEADMQVRVRPRVSLELVANRLISSTPFEYQGGGVHRAIVSSLKETTTGSLAVKVGERTAYEASGHAIGRGTFVIEFDGRKVVTTPDGSPLLPGHWRRVGYTPSESAARPESVHLVGDFNGWAPPSSDSAIELIPRLDGSYTAIVDLPAGAHHYAFLINGTREVSDPNAERTGYANGVERSVMVVGPTPREYGAAKENHINAEAIRHDPSLASDFSSISDGLGLVDISVSTLPRDAERAYVLVDLDKSSRGINLTAIPMTRSTDPVGFDRFTARIMTGSPSVEYRFEFVDGNVEYTTELYETAVKPQIDLPDWAMGAVWYQIFPERFRNGNPLNDPVRPGVFPMPWNGDWYGISDTEEKRWREQYGVPFGEDPAPRQGGFLYHVVWDRRYGGDLQGVVEKLDELKDLGVTAIYLNPVFEGDSMHKYDATSYAHIDDNFGTPESAGRPPGQFGFPKGENPADPNTWKWSAADQYFVETLLPAVRERGMHVIIDGVFNHVGRAHWAWQDVVRNGADSDYAEWFYAEFDDQGGLESWVAWDGPSGWLPKFRQQTDRDLVPGVKKQIFAITERWMDPNGDGDPSDGIDGWRLDVPLDVGLPFWKDWRKLVKGINPDAVIIAEIWNTHEADPVIRGEHFDTHMHYPFGVAVSEWLAVKPGMTREELVRRLDEAFNDAPPTNLIHMNMFASHDTDRLVSQLYNPGRGFDQQNRPQDNGPNYDGTRPDDRSFELSILAQAVAATYEGSPTIYYGDEYGMWGADDPTNRKPLPWPELGAMDNPEDDHIPGWRERYRAWFTLRQHPDIGPILRYGSTTHIETRSDDVFAFVRELNGSRVLVAVNRDENKAASMAPWLGDRVSGAEEARVGPTEARYWFLPRSPDAD